MKCKNCRHWQGHKHSEWADCYRIVATLEPNLKACYKSNDWGTIEHYWDVPFDPHDVKYWSSNSLWRTLYESITPEGLQKRVRITEDVINDVIFDRENGERVGKLKLKYFQTHKDYNCKEDL